MEVSQKVREGSASWDTLGSWPIYPGGKDSAGDASCLNYVSEEHHFSGFEGLVYRGDIVETSAYGVVVDALVSYHIHGNSENAAYASMVENIELRLFCCGHCPRFAAPEEGGEDAGFIYHGLGPHLNLGAAQEEAEGTHNLVGFDDAESDVGGIAGRKVYERSEVDEFSGSGDNATCGCGEWPCLGK